LRLALAFLLVSVVALVVATALTAKGVARDIAVIARQQEGGLAQAAAFTSGAAYEGVGWRHADLDPVFDLAERNGAAVEIRDHAGRVIGSSPGYASYPAARQRTLPVVAPAHAPGGSRVKVGQITVRFGGRGIGALAKTFEIQRLRGGIVAAAIAALMALIVSVIAARLIIVPIEVVLTAMRARAAGDRDYRICRARAPGELQELLEGFNDSSDAFDAMDRAQRNLLADVTHEVRTTAAILHADTEALADGMTQPTPANLGSLNAEVMRLVRMVDGLQRLAAAVSAETQLQRDRHDLAEIAAEVADRFADAFASAEITLNTRLEPAFVLCDRDRIQDVVSNLLANALKFTRSGGSVTVQTGQDDDRKAMVRVSDTGIGIPARELPRVTQRFFRGQRSASMAGGSGIGMAIVSALVRSHHGHLAIASEEGQGTQVTITLPASDI
jgi:two-component system sensor histidine kinase BaeS